MQLAQPEESEGVDALLALASIASIAENEPEILETVADEPAPRVKSPQLAAQAATNQAGPASRKRRDLRVDSQAPQGAHRSQSTSPVSAHRQQAAEGDGHDHECQQEFVQSSAFPKVVLRAVDASYALAGISTPHNSNMAVQQAPASIANTPFRDWRVHSVHATPHATVPFAQPHPAAFYAAAAAPSPAHACEGKPHQLGHHYQHQAAVLRSALGYSRSEPGALPHVLPVGMTLPIMLGGHGPIKGIRRLSDLGGAMMAPAVSAAEQGWEADADADGDVRAPKARRGEGMSLDGAPRRIPSGGDGAGAGDDAAAAGTSSGKEQKADLLQQLRLAQQLLMHQDKLSPDELQRVVKQLASLCQEAAAAPEPDLLARLGKRTSSSGGASGPHGGSSRRSSHAGEEGREPSPRGGAQRSPVQQQCEDGAAGVQSREQDERGAMAAEAKKDVAPGTGSASRRNSEGLPTVGSDGRAARSDSADAATAPASPTPGLDVYAEEGAALSSRQYHHSGGHHFLHHHPHQHMLLHPAHLPPRAPGSTAYRAVSSQSHERAVSASRLLAALAGAQAVYASRPTLPAGSPAGAHLSPADLASPAAVAALPILTPLASQQQQQLQVAPCSVEGGQLRPSPQLYLAAHHAAAAPGGVPVKYHAGHHGVLAGGPWAQVVPAAGGLLKVQVAPMAAAAVAGGDGAPLVHVQGLPSPNTDSMDAFVTVHTLQRAGAAHAAKAGAGLAAVAAAVQHA